MKLEFFEDVKTVKELKRTYHKMALENHPDRGGDHEKMVKIVLEYEWALENIFDKEGNRKAGTTASTGNYAAYNDFFRKALDDLMNLDGLELEVCGDWIWVRGNTKAIKEQLKAVGCWWASKKKAWYWKPADYTRKNRREWDMDRIRETYGTEIIKSTSSNKKLIA